MQKGPLLRRSDLASAIVNRIISLAPGVYALLKGLARRRAGTDPVTMFLKDPGSFYKLLLLYYKDPTTAMFIFRNLFIKPLAEYLGLYEKVDDLARAAREGCEELLKFISSSRPSIELDELGICVVDEKVPSAAGGGGGGRRASYVLPSRLTASLVEGIL